MPSDVGGQGKGLACLSPVIGEAEIDEAVDAVQRSLQKLPR
jgi:hypothetical protein